MSNSNREWTEKRIQKYIAEGRRQGEGKEYKPWLTVQDVPSRVAQGISGVQLKIQVFTGALHLTYLVAATSAVAAVFVSLVREPLNTGE